MGSSFSGSVDGVQVRLLDQILDQVRAGETPQADQLAAEHPQNAAEIRHLISVVKLIYDAAEQADPVADLDARVHLGRRKPILGDFQIVREVARGGMGVVYEALQISLNRRVALKVLLPGVTVCDRTLARFDREARTAGGLHHTHIVPVYAVGEEDGIPYYAMQYIEGESLSAFVKNARAAEFRASADYFRRVARWGRQIADALAHAHQHEVLHRDVKPSNILLDPQDDVWLTDFGLARHDAHVTLTLSGDVLGTARYMSPEQARSGGDDLDARTDVFALGATLYELLTLRPAFNGEDRESTFKKVLFDDPVPLRDVDRSIPRTLEAIVLRALQKNPAHRYAAAAQLAEDLRRYLNDEPTLAQPPTVIEQCRRLVARHKVPAALVSALIVSLAAFAATSTIQGHRLAQQRDRAVHEARKAERVTRFLQRILYAANPKQRDGERSLRQVLDDAAQQIGAEFAAEPDVELAIRQTIADTYMTIGDLGQAEQQWLRALDLQRRLGDLESPGYACVLNATVDALMALGKHERAEYLLREALPTFERLAPQGDERLASTYRQLGRALHRGCRSTAAESCFQKALDLRRRVLGADHRRTAESLNDLAGWRYGVRDFSGALELYLAELATLQRTVGENDLGTAFAHLCVAQCLVDLGDPRKLADAEAHVDQAMRGQRSVLGDSNFDLAVSFHYLASVRKAQRRFEDAEKLYLDAADLKRRVFGHDHFEVANSYGQLACLLADQDRHEEAANRYAECWRIRREALGSTHPDTLAALRSLARTHQRLERLDLARTEWQAYLDLLQKGSNPDAMLLAEAREALADGALPADATASVVSGRMLNETP